MGSCVVEIDNYFHGEIITWAYLFRVFGESKTKPINFKNAENIGKMPSIPMVSIKEYHS
jgi:hypothetical protein